MDGTSEQNAEDRLNEFQRATEQMLSAALTEVGGGIDGRHVGGKHEAYVECRLAGTDLRIFIYEDGAEVSSGPQSKERVHDQFEKSDFRSLRELSEAFVRRAATRAADWRAARGL